MGNIDRWYVLQDSDGKPVRVFENASTAVRDGLYAVAMGDDNLVEVAPASELQGAVGALLVARAALHVLCRERGSTDGYGSVFDQINAEITRLGGGQ